MFGGRIGPIGLVAVLFGMLTVPASATQYALNDHPPTPSNASRVTITESSDMASSNSDRYAVRFLDNTYESYSCKNGFTGKGCDLSDARFRHAASQILPVCQSPEQQHCVVGISGQLGDLEVAGEFIGYAGGDTMAANPGLGLYEASNVSLWKLPGLVHEGGTDTYAVNLRGMMGYDREKRRFSTSDLDASIHAYQLEEGSGFIPPRTENGYNDVLKKDQTATYGNTDCVWSDTGKCGRERKFATGTTIQLTAKVSNQISGWFRGRLKDPVIDIQKATNTTNLITISAQPVEVARFSVVATKETTSDKAYQILRYTGGNGFGVFNGTHKLLQASAGFSPDSYTVLAELRNLAKDTSAGISSLWSFSTIPSDVGNRCLSDSSRVLGIVTTNATVFDGTVPEFSRGFLNYKLAGMHFHKDGVTEVQGTYDLVIRSDVARCLYRLTKAPVSASITISGEGDKSIATTVVGEKNGWLKLAAYGFTFSQKTIKVKITQRKTTITCVSTSKPVKTRKVTGTNPKCPEGFRTR